MRFQLNFFSFKIGIAVQSYSGKHLNNALSVIYCTVIAKHYLDFTGKTQGYQPSQDCQVTDIPSTKCKQILMSEKNGYTINQDVT